MNWQRFLAAAVCSVGLAALAHAPAARSGGGGLDGLASVTLQQPLQIEPGYARVFIQNGHVVENRQLDRFDTYCDFEVRDVARAGSPPITIEPGQFRITRLQRSHIPAASIWSNSLLRDSPGRVELEVEMRLSSADQPRVLSLNCTRWSYDPLYHRHPDAGEIQRVLGGVAILS